MAAALTQDAVLDFLQGSGGLVKNSDLLLHFRNFIRDHADRDRNREIFKKFVNSVATVRQEDGVSYVVLKKQFRGGGGSSRPPQVPAGKITEPSPQRTNLIPSVSAEKSRLKPQLREAGTPAPAAETDRRTILPAAGIMINNNLKQLNSTAELSGRSAAAQVLSQIPEKTQLKTPSVPESPAQDQRSKGGQQRVGFGPLPGITPVAPAIRPHGETSQQVPAPPTLEGREVHLQSEGGLHQEPHLHHVSFDSEVTPRRFRYRPSYKSAVSCDDDEEEDEELPVRQSSRGAVWPVSVPLRDTLRTMSTSSPCIIDHPAPPSVVSSSSSSSERKAPKIFIQEVEGESLASRGPGWSSESGLEPVSLSGESAATRHSLPLKAEHYTPSLDHSPLHDVHQDHRYSQPAGVQLEPAQGLHQNQRAQLSSSHSSISPSPSDTGFSSSHWPPSGSSRGSGWNSSYEDLQAKTGTASVRMSKLKDECDDI